MKQVLWLLSACLILHASPSRAQSNRIIPGAERLDVYLPLLKGKRVGVFANPTSRVGTTHLVDTLLKRGVSVRLIFGPEHGFRGTADAGETVGNATDPATGIPVISLYGHKQRPSPQDLDSLDVLVFDIQDVGVRFYTYISSLQEFLEAALENHKPLLLLDRPNPNGFYVDGPVLDRRFTSFVGKQPVPVVYGMTLGEYARMLIGEHWLSPKADSVARYNVTTRPTADTPFHFLVIKCLHYTHRSRYTLPVRPSPNLPDMQSVYLYPSTCFFEGTVCSEGRGTDKPFQVFGHPLLPHTLYAFTPRPNEGARASKHYFQTCYGWDLSGSVDQVLGEVDKRVQIKWLVQAYRLFPGKDSFFLKNDHFNLLAGSDELKRQIRAGWSAQQIRASWAPAIRAFKQIRRRYLLYPDFE
ncbi:MAG TPA: DUF1343 domain-containing protein [Chitinophagaceae bacterium]|nr:DUF1343 domain-containing protein [Chitinophagaceae bacterium]